VRRDFVANVISRIQDALRPFRVLPKRLARVARLDYLRESIASSKSFANTRSALPGLTYDLLTLSRIEAAAWNLKFRPNPVEAIVNAA